MARNRNELNPEILRDRLPDNYRDVLDQAEKNVNKAVGQLIGDYKSHLESLAKQIEDGKFPENFQAKIFDLQQEFEKDTKQAIDKAKDIKEKAGELVQKTQNNKDLKELADALSTEAGTLQRIIEEARTKVKNIGELSGKAAGVALRKLVIGGL